MSNKPRLFTTLYEGVAIIEDWLAFEPLISTLQPNPHLSMTRYIILFLLVPCILRADDIKAVKVGDTEIKIPNPPGMVELPKDDSYGAMFTVMLPPGSTALKENVTGDMLQNRDNASSTPAFMALTLAPAVAITQNENDAAFQQLLAKIEQKFSTGTTVNDSDAPHFEEIKKKIAEASKSSGETVTATQGTSCFGPISKGDGFISILFTRNYSIHPKDKDIAQQSYFTTTYAHVNNKLLVIEVMRSNDSLDSKDLDILKTTTEGYVTNLLALNKPQSGP